MNLTNNKGVVYKWLQGFGFIKFEGRDVFVHRNSYLSGFYPEVGQLVLFDFGLAPDTSKPPMAVNVRVLKSAKQIADEQEAKRLLDTQAQQELRRGLEALAAKKHGGAA